MIRSFIATVSLLFAVHLLAFPIISAEPPAPEKPDPLKPAPLKPAPLKKDALQLIEGVRGGRHWVDAETAPPKSPEESMKCFQLEPGLEIQLVAAEPIVRDPVAISFDRLGRMFVVEYGDYPTGPEEEGADPLSRIVLLEDTDGDGRMDERTVFADKLNFAHSLMAYNGGLLVGAQTEILFLKDTDGDKVADLRHSLFTGFTPAHPQMQIGNPRWGLDNWVYLNYGPGKIASAAAPAKPVDMPRKDFRFHPHSLEFEADSGMGQFGNTVDRWGNRFYSTNRNPIMTTLLPPAVLQRNPYAVISPAHYDVGKSGGETRVYPLVKMKSNYLSHAGTHTSACGVTAYTGDLLGPDYYHSVFVCEPIGHLVTHSIVEQDGARLQARRARPKADFLASTDTWFRPASLANGPDGALYLADMYRLWVEHPKFLPPDVAAKLDWRAGEDRGRIYRIVPKDGSARKAQAFQPPESFEDMVALLDDSNSWRRFLGQRLLFEHQARTVSPQIRELFQTSDAPLTRLHAIWTLDGILSLQANDVLRGLGDSDPHVRRSAVQLAATRLDHEAIFQKVRALADDSNAQVRFQVALTLGNSDRPEATAGLASLALRDGQDPWFARGILTSSATRSGTILAALVGDESFVSQGDSANVDLVKQLASVVGTRGDLEELAEVFELLTDDRLQGDWWRSAIISGLGAGLPRHRGNLGRKSLSALLADPPENLKATAEELRGLLAGNQQTALDRSRRAVDRAAAVELLSYQPFEQASQALRELLGSDQPVAVQTAAIDALSRNGSPAAAQIVLERWEELGPAVRAPALALLLRRIESTRLALDAMSEGRMRPAALSIDQRVRLLKHTDTVIRTKAAELFGGAVSPNRREVAAKYQAALTLDASAEAGAKVFKGICAKCHRIDGEGHEAGPDISDVRNRSRSALLYDILDPNAKVEPRFTAYSVITVDGKIYDGLIASESADAIVLRMAEGKEQTIGRGEIDEIRSSKVSLMPEGIEKDISIQQMADLLEFLTTRKTTPTN